MLSHIDHGATFQIFDHNGNNIMCRFCSSLSKIAPWVLCESTITHSGCGVKHLFVGTPQSMCAFTKICFPTSITARLF
ncbi:MAG: hypothetical protein Harvfovirus16_4 [Harvfovirus sp.]|uniref:Uncharacterized protein n=1 Tax=Harvfovirus sp. TaxID=2487768 RepID=A0A3G5A3P0_9VIRU|nr:MAG: hypothetical protein Harvfovirus16_4 [Harvfovirus sp.]